MRYKRTDRFLAEFAKLNPHERALFLKAVADLNDAYARRDDRPLPDWPAHLRVKAVQDSAGIMEMTWSFSGPDGRATFQFVPLGGEVGIFWRRIGDHRIFKEP